MSGVWTGTSDDIHDSIYKYEEGVWSLVGNMKTPRKYHSVSVVRKDQILQNCI